MGAAGDVRKLERFPGVAAPLCHMPTQVQRELGPSALPSLFSKAMSSRARFTPILLFALSTTPGCMDLGLGAGGGSGASASADGGGEGDDFEAEPGSCNDWKVSYCDAVDECGSVREKSQCQGDVGYIACLADAPFATCATQLAQIAKNGACEKWPDGCEPEQIAERTDPYVVCVQLYRAVCEWRQYCNPLTTIEDCEMAMEAAAPCSGYYSRVPDVAQACIELYSSLSCGESIRPECVTDQFLKR